MRALPYWGVIDDLARTNGQCAMLLATPIRVDTSQYLSTTATGRVRVRSALSRLHPFGCMLQLAHRAHSPRLAVAMKINRPENQSIKPDGENRLGAYILGAAAIVLLVIAAIGFLRLFAT